MDRDQFEQLLYEEEGNTLDFKKEQYLFSKATDEEKSELLKDILGFANAWRRTTAYILIGVEDIRGGRGKIIGISPNDHLQDHALQQFVHNLTNYPVKFQYEAFCFEGKQIGIISIEEQIRPIYLKRDYGKLKKNEVYVRRGSSTDPTKPALPDEIATMRIGSSHEDALLFVQFCDIETGMLIGSSLDWKSEYYEMPSKYSIPDLPSPTNELWQSNILDQVNSNFYRQLADYEYVRRLCQPVRLAVKNTGKVAAKNVRVELTVPNQGEILTFEESDLPLRPNKKRFENATFLKSIRSIHKNPGDVNIENNFEGKMIKIDFGDLQPGRHICSDSFYIGSKMSQDILLSGKADADNLTIPKELALTISIFSKRKSITFEELKLMDKTHNKNT
ncbi:AlbA family DNA-binding domain-containing protein [Richelia sinica]|uniref:AlbA family DNA-binding domain-containing protein n=1 Tax=Richelia sinica TaxID=1357545 RepID=UPI001688C93E|nr:ATP-binding protein [Richelia sinica]MBD2665163.1 ATP-binding protein [Richelia sinica FACHB-800]